MAKKPARKPRAVSVYSNLAEKRRTKKDRAARKRAEYLASLPKHPVKRTLYRMHPKRVARYWFSKRGLFTALKITGVMILLLVLAVGAVFAYYRKDLEAIRPDKINERVQTTVSTYLDRNGTVLWEDKGDGDYWLAVKGDQISEYMKQATVAIEDKEFYKHQGVSFTGIVRASLSNAQQNNVQGGSTLTQQLVKQVFLAEDKDKRGLDGIPRKIKEVILAVEIERTYNKEQILNLYLNESPYGGRRNGVESAAQTYFGKSAKDLNLAESALLAAIPNSPSLYNPYNTDPDANPALIARQRKTLDSMVEMGYIKQSEADAAKKVDIISSIKPEADQYANIKAPHFVRMVRDQLEKELGKAIVGRGGLTVKTTLDLRIQDKTQEAMDKMFASSWPAVGGFSNGASTVLDAQTGQVIAMVGSRDFNYAGFGQDNAANAYIQPGSSIKPLVYASLFEDKGTGNQNFGSGSILSDEKLPATIYKDLNNWDRKFMGSINIRRGLALSRNVPAVKAMHITGVDTTLAKIREAGDASYCTVGNEKQVGLASAIGGCGARMVEHTNAIATLARMGTYKPYSMVLEVKNSSGDVLKKFTESSKQVFDPQSAYIVNDILSDDNARAALVGRNRYGMVVPGVRTAIKTGTSDFGGNGKDLWNVSYSPAIAMSVWLGNSDNSILKQSNSTIPSQIVGDVMSFAHTEVYAKEGKWKSGDWFAAPDGIQTIGGELYPSWYNRSQSQGSEKIMFDKVSKKKATACTPDSAKIEVNVTSYTDPISKKKIYSAPGYDPNAEDDVHKCTDAKPTVSVNPSGNGRTITVTYGGGTHALANVVVSIDGTEVANFATSTSGSRTIPNSVGVSAGQYTVKATVTDAVSYTGTDSTTWKR